jgi:hypothetical protein
VPTGHIGLSLLKIQCELFESLAVAALIGFMSAFVSARAAVRRSIVDTLRAVA